MRKLMMALLGFLALVLFAEEDIRTAWSDYFAMDAGKTSVISVSGQVRISPIAEEESGTGMLLVDGEPAKGWTRYNPLWDTTSVTDGAHRLTLTGENVGVELYIINDNSTVYTHQGTLTRDEIWPADKPHLVTADVRIPIDKSLTIAEDAAIFFKTGTKIICQGGRVDFSPLVSEPFHLDVRSSRLATGIEYVSPVAVTESPEARLLVDGQPVNSWTRDNPWWDSRSVEEGRHLLALAGENVSVEVEVLRGTSAFVHEGVLAEDETWTADKEHIVTHWVHIPEGVSMTIADGATVRFCENTGLVNKGNLTWGNGLHLILDSIADGAFENFTNLSTVELSDSVTSIGDNAFAGCTNLEEIVFSRNLTNIGENAFQRCAKLTSLRFPEGPTTIGAGAFSGCTRLKEIAFAGYPPVYQGTGRLFPHREALITAYKNDTRRWSDWKGYGWSDEAFNQVNVQLVDFPVSGDYTYQIDCRNCAWLVSYNGSDSVLELPEKLDDLSLWEIYKNAFYDKSFSRLTIPASVEMLREGAMGHVACDYLFFTGERPPQIADNDLCPNASPHLLVPETPGWNGVIEEGWIFHREAISYLDKDFGYRVEEDGTATITRYVGDSDMIVPDELSGHPVLTIPSGCFQNNSDITSVTIAKGVEHIGANAFQGCPNLATVTIGGSVTDIGANAFQGCPNLATVTIGGSVTDIGANAFQGCPNLATVTIGDSVTSIGDNAFQGCPNLATVTIGDGVTDIGANAFKDCSKLATLTIGNSVTSIGDNAFQNCSSLTSVVIPDLVEEIPANAFSGCTNLVSVQLPYRLQSIDESAFNYNDSLEEIHFPGTPEQADTWLDFMPAVTLYVFSDQGWPEVLDDDGTYFGLKVVTGNDARLYLTYSGGLLNCYGGEGEISVSASGKWKAVSNVPWLKVLTPSGKGNGVVRFSYELNPLGTSRAGSLSVNLTKYGVSKNIEVEQERFRCILTVNGETTYPEEGDEITVTAEPREGHDFTGWETTGVVLEHPENATQTFLMPRKAVTLTAVYAVHVHTLTLDGEASEQAFGTAIEVAAPDRRGHTFTNWTATGLQLADPTAKAQSFSMPDNDVVLTRVYSVNSYALTVNGETVQQQYDTTVSVTAEDRKHHEFLDWTATGITLANPQAKSQSFAMPDNDVSLTANYLKYTSTVYYLQAGWNLLTVTSDLEEESRDLLLPLNPIPWEEDDKAFALTGETDFTPGKPLWVYSQDEKPLILYGKPLPDWELPLNSGWRLVGIVKEIPVSSLPDTVNVQEWIGYGYREKTKGTLEAGKAYWLFAE